MIVGLGEDLVEIDRIAKLIEKRGDVFLQKCFTVKEIDSANKLPTENRKIAYFAKRYAAKEACLKAIGTGMREGLSWQDMETGNDDLGRPVMTLSGGVAKKLSYLVQDPLKPQIHITLSDEAGLAKATVILEAV